MIKTDSKTYLEILQLIPSQDVCEDERKYRGITSEHLTQKFNDRTVKKYLTLNEMDEYLAQMIKDGRVRRYERKSMLRRLFQQKSQAIYFRPYAPSDNFFGGGFLF